MLRILDLYAFPAAVVVLVVLCITRLFFPHL
jgi:hypothetical protein